MLNGISLVRLKVKVMFAFTRMRTLGKEKRPALLRWPYQDSGLLGFK
jgi:hypothetical protein